MDPVLFADTFDVRCKLSGAGIGPAAGRFDDSPALARPVGGESGTSKYSPRLLLLSAIPWAADVPSASFPVVGVVGVAGANRDLTLLNKLDIT